MSLTVNQVIDKHIDGTLIEIALIWVDLEDIQSIFDIVS